MGILRPWWVAATILALCGFTSHAFAVEAPAPAAPKPEVSAPGKHVDEYVPPPRTLHLVGDHWTPYDPPKPPDGAQVHTVVAGDCLWSLAQHYYNDPYLWPTIWDANRWVTYSHWIYPGDPLVIPPKPTVVGEKGPTSPPPAPEAPPPEAPPPPPAPAAPAQRAEAPHPPAPAGPVLVPAAESLEIACAGQLVEQFDPTPLVVYGRENAEKELQGQGDILYLSAGKDMGIKPGAEYAIVRPGGPVQNPDTGRPQAVYVRRMGRVRVLAVQARTSTAEVTMSCDAVKEGDYLTPYREMPVPMIERASLRDLATPNPGRMVGVVLVLSAQGATIAGAGEIVGIDLSSRAGLTAGDRVLFWTPGPGRAPRTVFAQGVVISTNGGGSMVKILESAREVKAGDKVEVL